MMLFSSVALGSTVHLAVGLDRPDQREGGTESPVESTASRPVKNRGDFDRRSEDDLSGYMRRPGHPEGEETAGSATSVIPYEGATEGTRASSTSTDVAVGIGRSNRHHGQAMSAGSTASRTVTNRGGRHLSGEDDAAATSGSARPDEPRTILAVHLAVDMRRPGRGASEAPAGSTTPNGRRGDASNTPATVTQTDMRRPGRGDCGETSTGSTSSSSAAGGETKNSDAVEPGGPGQREAISLTGDGSSRSTTREEAERRPELDRNEELIPKGVRRPDRESREERPAGATASEAHGNGGGVSSTPARAVQTDIDRPGQRKDGLRAPAGSTASAVRGDPADPSDTVSSLRAQGAGRRKLAAELNISEHAARQLLAGRRNGSSR